MSLVVLTGYSYDGVRVASMGSGKDTVADFMNKHDYASIALADPIKRIAMDLWHFSEQQLWGPSEFRNAPDKRYLINGEYLTPRRVLQILGTEGGRACDPDVWTRKTSEIAKALINNKDSVYSRNSGIVQKYGNHNTSPFRIGVVVSDGRFLSEISYLKKEGFKIVRIKRKVDTLSDAILHSSEQELVSVEDSYFDYVIDNGGSLDDLEQKTKEMCFVFNS